MSTTEEDRSNKRTKLFHDVEEQNSSNNGSPQQTQLPPVQPPKQQQRRRRRRSHPLSFVTWNCNGFTSRTKWDTEQLNKLVQQTNYPDMIMIQEARLRASGSIHHQRGKPQDSELYGGGSSSNKKKTSSSNQDDGPSVNDVLSTVFKDYHPVWSLADTKYSGTLSLLHQRLFSANDAANTSLSSCNGDNDGSKDHTNDDSDKNDNNEMKEKCTDPIAGVTLQEFKKDLSSFAAFSPQSAIDVILQKLGTTRKECGISSSSTSSSTSSSGSSEKGQQSLMSFFGASASKKGHSTAGVKAPTSNGKKSIQQTTMRSFFSPKTTTKSIPGSTTDKTNSAAAASPPSSPSHVPRRMMPPKHHPEGRFQVFCFPDMDVIQMYVPNNGTKDESFEKRRRWDEDLLKFIQDRKTILSKINDPSSMTTSSSPKTDKSTSSLPRGDWTINRPILLCGDLNCAHKYKDGSHWEKRQSNDGNSSDVCSGSIYEWWRDEAKCFVKSDNKGSNKTKRPENVGIPGFTRAERDRFSNLLQEGNFMDVWRGMYPEGDTTTTNNNAGRSVWDGPNFTWRGHLARGNYAAKYQGKGQRLDYFLLSPSEHVDLGMNDSTKSQNEDSNNSTPSLKVISCKILGYGENREGLYCGSDHCAVQMILEE